jgi:hypothetical protein
VAPAAMDLIETACTEWTARLGVTRPARRMSVIGGEPEMTGT